MNFTRFDSLSPSNLVALLLAFIACVAVAPNAFGHATDETYIWLNPRENRQGDEVIESFYAGRVEFRLPDLRKYLDMDVPEDFDEARKFVIEHADELEEYVRKHFEMKNLDGSEISYEIVHVDLLKANFFGHFAQIFFRTPNFDLPDGVPAKIVVKSTFLFDKDRFSRCLLCTTYNKFTGQTHKESFFHAVYSPWNDEQEIDFNDISLVKGGERYYIWEGIRHIWIGLDHILFLVTLLLASVLVKRPIRGDKSKSNAESGLTDSIQQSTGLTPKYEWVPVESFLGALWNVLKIVTIFTVAHSITLALASFEIISLPSRLIESIIALSIVLVAINNIIPTFRDRTWIILFLFGLFHGMGFASVMQNLPFRMPDLTSLLLCFNVGVELGQLVIVAAVFPFIFLLRNTSFYKPVILIGGSLVMIAIAGYWFVERAMGWG